MLKLPLRMEEVLIMFSGQGLREVDIAEKLGVSRQAVNKSLREARARLTRIFLELAEVLNSDIVRINVEKGCMVLRNRQRGVKIYVLYVSGKGPQILLSKDFGHLNVNRVYYERMIEEAVKWGLLSPRVKELGLREALEKLVAKMEE